MTMADRLAVMSEGQIVQCGTPHQVYEYPQSRFVASFIGSTNLFDGVIVEDAPDHIALESPDLPQRFYLNHGVSEPLGMRVTVSVRPERIAVLREQPAGTDNWARGSVSHVAYMGSHTLYQVRLDSGKVIDASVPSIVLAGGGGAGMDDEVYLRWAADSATVLSA